MGARAQHQHRPGAGRCHGGIPKCADVGDHRQEAARSQGDRNSQRLGGAIKKSQRHRWSAGVRPAGVQVCECRGIDPLHGRRLDGGRGQALRGVVQECVAADDRALCLFRQWQLGDGGTTDQDGNRRVLQRPRVVRGDRPVRGERLWQRQHSAHDRLPNRPVPGDHTRAALRATGDWPAHRRGGGGMAAGRRSLRLERQPDPQGARVHREVRDRGGCAVPALPRSHRQIWFWRAQQLLHQDFHREPRELLADI